MVHRGDASEGGAASREALPVNDKAVAKLRREASQVKKEEREAVRRAYYESQTRNGVFIPCPKAVQVSGAGPNEAQLVCPHPYDELLWHGNAHATQAACRRCMLQKVIYPASRAADRRSLHLRQRRVARTW